MKFQVEVTRRAQRDIDAAYDWYKERSPQGAAAWHEDIVTALERLETLPTRCRIAEIETQAFGVEVRQLPCRKHRLLFTIDENTVVVLTVRHTARKPLRPL